MAKQTIYIESPAHLSSKQKQLIISKEGSCYTLPLEDLHVLVLNNLQITISAHLMSLLAKYNIALITCDNKNLPTSLSLPTNTSSLQYNTAKTQLDALKPLKKQIWQTIIKCKIENQSQVLKLLKKPYVKVQNYENSVTSGDSTNREAVAAKVYFNQLLPDSRREGIYTKSLDYGYSLVRASIARKLSSAGFLLFLGIHHENKQNAFNLADDLIEPFRPLVDLLVISKGIKTPLTHKTKELLYEIFEYTLLVDGQVLSLEDAIQFSLDSFKRALEKKKRSLFKPPFIKDLRKVEIE